MVRARGVALRRNWVRSVKRVRIPVEARALGLFGARGVGFDRRKRCRGFPRHVGVRAFALSKSDEEIIDSPPRGVLPGSQSGNDFPVAQLPRE